MRKRYNTPRGATNKYVQCTVIFSLSNNAKKPVRIHQAIEFLNDKNEIYFWITSTTNNRPG